MKISRRETLVGGMAAVTAVMGSNARAAAATDDPTLEFAFELVASLEVPMQLGDTGIGQRRIIGVTGGTVKGPMLNGIVLPGGADWQVVRPDGVTDISARYTLQADDGALIYVDAPGIREATPGSHREDQRRRDRGPVRVLFPDPAATRNLFRKICLDEPPPVRVQGRAVTGWS